MKNAFYDSCQIDTDIRRLLFANPSLGMPTCLEIFKTLKSKTDTEKEKLRNWLKESVALFKSKARIQDDDSLLLELNEQVRKHVELWEKEFGEVSLTEMQYLTDSTDISLADIGWEKGKITPASITSLLDEFMVGQEDYKRELGLVFYSHLLRIRRPELNIPKTNRLVYGPSGMGKTSGVKVLSDKLGINRGLVNFERVVPEGIVGAKITDPLTRTLGKKKNDMILIGDEADKIHDDEVQQELLSILDDKNMISYPTTFSNYREYREIPSRNVTCILCGKYEALKKTVQKRLDIHKVGFAAKQGKDYSADELYAQVNLDDLKAVLGSEEICGRIGNFVSVRQLGADDLSCIMLNKRDSIISRYQAYFSVSQANLELTQDGAKEIAAFTIANYANLGVRGLEIVVRSLLKDYMLKVGDLRGQEIVLDKEYVCSHLIHNNN